MDAIALATTDGLREEAKGAAGDLAMELHCECPIHTFVVYCALAIERESRYLGVCEKTGLIHLRLTAKRRATLAFLFRARLGGVTATHVMLASCDNVTRRGAAPTPPNWKALIAASALPCKIKAKAEELQE